MLNDCPGNSKHSQAGSVHLYLVNSLNNQHCTKLSKQPDQTSMERHKENNSTEASLEQFCAGRRKSHRDGAWSWFLLWKDLLAAWAEVLWAGQVLFIQRFEAGIRKLFQGLDQSFRLVWWTRSEHQSLSMPRNIVLMSCTRWNWGLWRGHSTPFPCLNYMGFGATNVFPKPSSLSASFLCWTNFCVSGPSCWWK